MVTTNFDVYDFCSAMTEEQDRATRELLEKFSGKWALEVLQVLAEARGPLRFSRVMERVEGISQKVLTQTLRMLEGEGLVKRTLYPQVPPRVEYELTPLGRGLLDAIVPLWKWIVDHLPAFEKARAVAEAKAAE